MRRRKAKTSSDFETLIGVPAIREVPVGARTSTYRGTGPVFSSRQGRRREGKDGCDVDELIEDGPRRHGRGR